MNETMTILSSLPASHVIGDNVPVRFFDTTSSNVIGAPVNLGFGGTKNPGKETFKKLQKEKEK